VRSKVLWDEKVVVKSARKALKLQQFKITFVPERFLCIFKSNILNE